MREGSLSKLLTTTTADVYYYSSARAARLVNFSKPAPCTCSLSSNVTNTEFWQMVCNKITCVIEGAACLCIREHVSTELRVSNFGIEFDDLICCFAQSGRDFLGWTERSIYNVQMTSLASPSTATASMWAMNKTPHGHKPSTSCWLKLK